MIDSISTKAVVDATTTELDMNKTVHTIKRV